MIVRIIDNEQEVEGTPEELVEYFMSLEREHSRFEIEQKLYLLEAYRQFYKENKKEEKNGRKRNTKEN